MKVKYGTFRPEDLVPFTEPIYRWGCPGCGAKLTLKPDDPRARAELAPRCERCGHFPMAPINDVRERPN